MITFELTDLSHSQLSHLRLFWNPEKIDEHTFNVSVKDSDVDSLVEWLDDSDIEYQML